MPTLEISVLGARNFKRADPYITATSDGQSFTTVVRRKTKTPQWSEIFRFEVYPASSQTILITLMDKCVFKDDAIGSYELGLNGFTQGQVTTRWVMLRASKESCLEIELRTLAVDFGATPPPGTPMWRSLQDYVPGRDQQLQQQEQQRPGFYTEQQRQQYAQQQQYNQDQTVCTQEPRGWNAFMVWQQQTCATPNMGGKLFYPERFNMRHVDYSYEPQGGPTNEVPPQYGQPAPNYPQQAYQTRN